MDAFYRTFVSLKTALYFNVAYSLKKKNLSIFVINSSYLFNKIVKLHHYFSIYCTALGSPL